MHLFQQLSSPKLFLRCEISCEVWSFTTKTTSVSRCFSNHLKSDFSTINWIAESEEIRYVYSTEILLNTAAIREVKLGWTWFKFYSKRNTGLCAITAPNYKQPSKLSQLQNTQLNLLTVTFLAILRWTEINLRWLILDGCVKKAKDWRLPLTFGSEI